MHPPKPTDIHSEAFLHALMREQLKLSIACAAAFLVVLLGLPAANYFFPEFMDQRLFGFTLSWFVLGVGFFPAVWVIAWIFIRRSIRLEDEVTREAGARGPELSGSSTTPN
jgi:putative solute:sodium symporter small subunit